MKKLILVRHAKTVQLQDYSKSDFDRELLPRGHKDSELIARHLKAKGYMPDLMISSTAKRAQQTAVLFAENFGYPTGKIQNEQFIYDGYTTSQMLQFISGCSNNIDTIIIFGHNPDIAGFTINLIEDDLWHFPTGCASVIAFDVDSWKDIEARAGKLELHVYPGMLKE